MLGSRTASKRKAHNSTGDPGVRHSKRLRAEAFLRGETITAEDIARVGELTPATINAVANRASHVDIARKIKQPKSVKARTFTKTTTNSDRHQIDQVVSTSFTTDAVDTRTVNYLLSPQESIGKGARRQDVSSKQASYARDLARAKEYPNPPNTKMIFPFMLLPGELRNKIYDYVFEGDMVYARPSITQVNQQIREETRLLYLQMTHFVPLSNFSTWLSLVTPKDASYFEDIRLGRSCECTSKTGADALDIHPVLQFAVAHPKCNIEAVATCTNDGRCCSSQASSAMPEKQSSTSLEEADREPIAMIYHTGTNKTSRFSHTILNCVCSTILKQRESLQNLIDSVRESSEWRKVITAGHIVEVHVNNDADVRKLVYRDAGGCEKSLRERQELWCSVAALPGCEYAVVLDVEDVDVDMDSEDDGWE